jgi:hypothetical protein
MSDLFWLNVDRFARLAPHVPTDTRGKPRVDDRLARNFLAAVCLAATVGCWL